MHKLFLFSFLALLPVTFTAPTLDRCSFEAVAYKDQGGNWTIGYGHLCNPVKKCTEIKYSVPLSAADGLSLFNTDIAAKTTCVNQNMLDTVKLTNNQYGAIVSWAYNAGCTNTRRSSLLRRLNAGEDPNKVISEELPKWNKVDGKPSNGLTARRAAEVALAKTPSTVFTYPCNDPDNDGDPGDPSEGSE